MERLRILGSRNSKVEVIGSKASLSSSFWSASLILSSSPSVFFSSIVFNFSSMFWISSSKSSIRSAIASFSVPQFEVSFEIILSVVTYSLNKLGASGKSANKLLKNVESEIKGIVVLKKI